MAGVAAPPPIPGEPIDPPPKEPPEVVESLDERSPVAGIAYRAFLRFSHAKASLLAAGTTYYLFLAMFALLAFGYGLAATFGSDELSEWLTDALEEALPGLVGDEGIDPDQLRAVGDASSLIGLGLLLYSGGGAMVAAGNSLHLIYGAPPDPRSFLVARVRLLAWLAIVAPLILVSFAIPTFIASVATDVEGVLGSTDVPTWLWVVVSLAVTAAVDFAILYLLVGILGGIRPERRARVIGAATGTIVVTVLKFFLAFIVSWSIDRPQYGAFALPITILLILYLLTMGLYASAAVTAGVADRGVALADLVPDEGSGGPSEG
jgi:uncharacterized BrkB/YihY/UPF0761 family membrane protein